MHEQTKGSMAQKFDEGFHFFEFFFIVHSSKKGKQTIHFQRTTQTKKHQAIITPQWVFGLISTVGIEGLVVVEARNFRRENLTNLAHRQQLRETECKTTKTAKLVLKCHKKQVSQQKSTEGNSSRPDFRSTVQKNQHTYAERVHTASK